MTGIKTCSHCREEKPISEFTKSRHRKDGRNPRCRVCTRASVKRTADKNPEAARKRGAEWYAKNKERRLQKAKEWLAANPGKAAEYSARWSAKNPGKMNAAGREWYWKNRERALATDKAQREADLENFLIRERESYTRNAKARSLRHKEWSAKNRDRISYYASARRAAVIKRTPPWVSEEQLLEILRFFTKARVLSEKTGIEHHVDHIVPLRGRKVSGLNVPWNLQVLPAIENLKKTNRHEP